MDSELSALQTVLDEYELRNLADLIDYLPKGWGVPWEVVRVLKAEIERMRSVVEAAEVFQEDAWLGDCPYYATWSGETFHGLCSYGCHDEPLCVTCCPPEGWGEAPVDLLSKALSVYSGEREMSE